MVFIQRLLCRLQASVFPCPQLTGIDQDILFLLVFRNQRAAVMIPRQILKRVRIGGEMKRAACKKAPAALDAPHRGLG